MTTPLDALRERLLDLQSEDAPLVSATFDLRPDAQGQVHVDLVLKQTLRHEARLDDVKRERDVRSLEADHVAIEEAAGSAVQEGAQGLVYVGAAEAGIRHVLTTPLPFRNAVRVGEQPSLAEIDRYRFLYSRPVVVARAHHDHADIHRIELGRQVASEELETAKGEVSSVSGRTNRDQAVLAGAGGLTGGHSMNKVEEVIEANQVAFARDTAAELVKLLGDDDLVVLSGPDEPKSMLRNGLPVHVLERVVEADVPERELSSRALADLAGRLAAEHQLAQGDAMAADLVNGASPDRTATGVTAVTDMLAQGRVDTLVLHEDAFGHFGDAEDTRHHEGVLPAETVEALIRGAAGHGSAVWFARHEPLLELHEGVAAYLRW